MPSEKIFIINARTQNNATEIKKIKQTKKEHAIYCDKYKKQNTGNLPSPSCLSTVLWKYLASLPSSSALCAIPACAETCNLCPPHLTARQVVHVQKLNLSSACYHVWMFVLTCNLSIQDQENQVNGRWCWPPLCHHQPWAMSIVDSHPPPICPAPMYRPGPLPDSMLGHHLWQVDPTTLSASPAHTVLSSSLLHYILGLW
jgi:hypothetical protein